MGIARKGGGGVKACQDGLGHFFPGFPHISHNRIDTSQIHCGYSSNKSFCQRLKLIKYLILNIYQIQPSSTHLLL